MYIYTRKSIRFSNKILEKEVREILTMDDVLRKLINKLEEYVADNQLLMPPEVDTIRQLSIADIKIVLANQVKPRMNEVDDCIRKTVPEPHREKIKNYVLAMCSLVR